MRVDNVRIGVIGGSGLYQMEGLEDVHEVEIATPFGKPSDSITIGRLGDVSVAFLPRHGKGHTIMPSNIPSKANIYALKHLGVERIISVSAVGSLREKIAPLDLVIPDQLIDRTRLRENTFFDEGLVAHIGFAEPFCPHLSGMLGHAALQSSDRIHLTGTCIVMEGPAFSTKAESLMYRSWGASIIGMTALPEAKLAREAELCYAMLACVTDYDVWHETEKPVSVELIIANLQQNASRSQEVLKTLIPRLSEGRDCGCDSALENGIITHQSLVPKETIERLQFLIGKYST